MAVGHEKESTLKKQDQVSEKEVQEILDHLNNFSEAKNNFLRIMPVWKKSREETISQLYQIANECDDLHKGCNIANVTGSSVGAAGGLMALGGILLSPFTFGASLGLTVAGAATGVAGAATNITTSIVESSKMKDKCQAAQDYLDKDKSKTEELGAIVEILIGYVEKLELLQAKLEKIVKLEGISVGLDGTILVANTASSACGIAKSVQALQLIKSFTAAEISVLKECPKMLKGLKAFKDTSLVAGKVATFFAVVGLGISIYEIVTTSQDIHEGSKSEAATRLRENAENLKTQMNSLCEVEKSLRGD
eukprot:gene4464-20708_t